ncbi:MAG: hypothetical protein JXB05_25370 [Myxococcaceae bacterium]|nr:hypothetical protein [Myxococcaceae bacterium]
MPHEGLNRPRELFGNALTRASGLVDGKLVDAENSSEAVYSMDALGRRWVRKKMLYTGWQPILAESIGWLLAREIGLRVPAGAVGGTGNELSWLSAYIGDALHWQRGLAHFVKNIDEFGAMLTLDAIIFNDDRHSKNILLVPDQGEEDYVAWAIDVGNARVGYPTEFAALGLDVPTKPNIARGLPIELMKVGAFAAAKKAAQLAGTQTLARYVGEACDVVGESTANLLLGALSERMKHAGELVERYMQVIEGIP